MYMSMNNRFKGMKIIYHLKMYKSHNNLMIIQLILV